jgi:hypothetical protein
MVSTVVNISIAGQVRKFSAMRRYRSPPGKNEYVISEQDKYSSGVVVVVFAASEE